MKIVISGYCNTKTKCEICGKYLSLKTAGNDIINIGEPYLRRFVHAECLAKRTEEIGKIVNGGNK